MNRHLPSRILMIAAALLLARTSPALAADWLGPLDIIAAKDGKTLYIAEYDARQLDIYSLAANKVASKIPLPGRPGALALSPDGATLYIAIAEPEGTIQAADAKTGQPQFTLPAGHTPSALAISPDGKTLFVANRFNNSITVIDTTTRAAKTQIPALREPVSLALTPDGKTLLVSNLLPTGASSEDYTAAAVSIINATDCKLTTSVLLPNGSTALRGICASPDGKYAYVVHALAHYQLPTTQLERGWMNTSAVSIIDIAAGKLHNTVLLDDVDLGAANPWGALCTPDGKTLLVTHGGTHEISLINRPALHEKLNKVATGHKVSDASTNAADVPSDLSFLVDLRKRVKLPGNGPRQIAIAGNKAYATEYFTDTLAAINLTPDPKPEVKSLPLGPAPKMTKARRGEMIFSNADHCFQKWQSCSSCHPDARTDALNWDLLNDGIGNPKNTRSMLFTHRMPPVMSHGVRGDAETAVRAGFKFIQFTVLPEEDYKSVDEYLKSLQPVPSPYLIKGQLSEAAKRGQIIFDKAGCSSCHSGPLFTDLKLYDVGTGEKGPEQKRPLKAFTLREVWRTGPWLHNGCAATMKEVFTKFNPRDEHGSTSKLTPSELDDLIEYIMSL